MVKAIPDGAAPVTPYPAVEFRKKVFGALETMRRPGKAGRAEIQIGNARRAPKG